MQRRNQELRHFTLKITNNGSDIIRFLKHDVLDAVDPNVLVGHKIAAARILARVGLEDGREYIKDGKIPSLPNPKKPDRLFKIWRSITGSRADIYQAARKETRDGVRIMIFFNEVMNGRKPGFKPQHRLAAARELLNHVEYTPVGREAMLPLNHGMNVWPGQTPDSKPAPPAEYLNADEYQAAARSMTPYLPAGINDDSTDEPASKNDAQPANDENPTIADLMTDSLEEPAINSPIAEPPSENEVQPANHATAPQPANDEDPTIADLMTDSLEEPAANGAETEPEEPQPTDSHDTTAETGTEPEEDPPEPQAKKEEFTPEEIDRLINRPLISYFLEESEDGEEIPPKPPAVLEAYGEYQELHCLPESESIYQSIIRRSAAETGPEAQLERAQKLVEEFNRFVFQRSEYDRPVAVDDRLIAESLAELAKSPDAPKFDVLRLLDSDDHYFYYCICEDCEQCDEYDFIYERGLYDNSMERLHSHDHDP